MSEPVASNPIEVDPLLQFCTEAPAPVEPAAAASEDAQPVAPVADPPNDTSPPPADSRFEEMRARIDALQKTIDETRQQLASMKSDVATLVRANENNARHRARITPATAAVAPLPRPARSSAYRVGSAIAGVILGVIAGVMIWIKMSGTSAPLAAPHEEPRPEVAAPTEPGPEVQPVALQSATPVPAPVTPAREPRSADEVPMKPQVASYVGTLSIDSEPGGEVFINRQTAGRTPLRVPNLRAGAHLVWIEREGYRRFTRVVEVPADRVTRVSASLEPLSTR